MQAQAYIHWDVWIKYGHPCFRILHNYRIYWYKNDIFFHGNNIIDGVCILYQVKCFMKWFLGSKVTIVTICCSFESSFFDRLRHCEMCINCNQYIFNSWRILRLAELMQLSVVASHFSNVKLDVHIIFKYQSSHDQIEQACFTAHAWHFAIHISAS